ncbi:nucleoporin gle1-like [Plakobranchus ocellatus]|uniref:mRNA export factor GLE1 n=1 Tax=Plakobranchus ocellatus TaxID=259542 RepID=A0AAV4BRS3_9GAST|nr:nucleoporin gle1-like [Plakobranchus ocellatus]
MPVPQGLRNTPKARLNYNNDASKLKADLDELSPPPLSRNYQETKCSPTLDGSFGLYEDPSVSNRLPKEDPALQPNSFNEENSSHDGHKIISQKVKSPLYYGDLNSSCSNGQEKRIEIYQSAGKLSHMDQYCPSLEERLSSPLSPTYWDANDAIMKKEEEYNNKVEISRLTLCKRYDKHNRDLSNEMKRKSQAVIEMSKHKEEKRRLSMDKKRQEETEEVNKALKSWREKHERHKEKLDSKQREIDKKRVDLEREQKKRQEEFDQRLQKLKSFADLAEESRAKFNQIHDSFPHKTLFPEAIGKWKVMLDKISASLPVQLQRAAQYSSISDELLASFQSHAENSQIVLNNLSKQIVSIESQLKAAAEQKKEEEAKKAEDQKKAENAKKQETEALQDCGVQALSFALKERKSKADLLTQVQATIKGFITSSDPRMKQYRFDLQRAVNTPINAISGVDPDHLRDKLHRLLALLRGQEVRVGGKVVRADQVPEAPLFCQNLIAKMLVKKGEEQVSSLHESAFPIAAVILGLWCEFPMVGSLFLAHLQALCPYVLPYYHTRQEGQSNADYHRTLGYKVEENGTVEEQDKFLRRMSGLMRLYCACLVTAPPPPTPGGATRPPQNQNRFPHPHSLEHGWMWLARSMDQDPHPDVTASLIYDTLVTTGSQLLRQYSIQFIKLVYLLYKQYLPKLKEVAVTSATLGRLEIFLEAALKSGRFPEPDGQLESGFWFS